MSTSGRRRTMPSSAGAALTSMPVASCSRAGEHHGPRSVHPGAEGGVDDHAASRRARRGSARRGWSGRPAAGRWPRAGRRGRRRRCPWPRRPARRAASRSAAVPSVEVAGQLAGGGAERPAELGGPAGGVALPERQPAGLAGGGGDEHPVGGDGLDAPGAGAEGEDVAHAGLVDHLLVELAHPAPGAPGAGGDVGRRPAGVGHRAGGEVHPVQAAVGDGAAGGDGQPQRARARRERAGGAVPHDARAQLGEVLAGVAAGEHVEHGGEGARRPRVANGAARRASAATSSTVQLVEGEHRHDLLGEDVQRVGRDVDLLDEPRLRAGGADRGGQQVAAVGRQHDAVGDGADLVPGPADALQRRGHRRRGAHLDHEVHRAHVDAELEARGRHDGAQPPGLQLGLGAHPLLPAHRAVVGPGDHLGGGQGGARLPGRRGGPGGAGGPGGVARPDAVGARLPLLVEAGGEPLGRAAGVGEDDRRAVRRRRGRPPARSRCGHTEGWRCSGGAPAAAPERSGPSSSRRSRAAVRSGVAAGSARSSTGTTTSMRSSLLLAGSHHPHRPAAVGQRPVPGEERRDGGDGRTVAESPTRWAGAGSSASRRSRDRARCAPRLVPARAWISSTITVRTPRSPSRAAEVSTR